MRKQAWVMGCLVVSAFLSACSGTFQRPAATTDYGNPPQGYEEAIKNHFGQTLFDSESARYRFGRPVRAYSNEGLVYGGKVEWVGHVVDVQVNGKNRFGGYVGFKPYMALFSGERLVSVIDGREHILLHRME